MASLARPLEGLPGRLVKLASVYRWTKARVIRDVAGARTLQRHLQELLAYLEANRSALVNYAARHRRGELFRPRSLRALSTKSLRAG
jgi:hypothetical protein